MQYIPAAAEPAALHRYAQRFSATRRGARLARLMGTQQLAEWGVPHDTGSSDTAALVIAELASNAALHAPPNDQGQGRDFQLRLQLAADRLRIEVTDVYPERGLPGVPTRPAPDREQGRGLYLVATLAHTWGVGFFPPTGKTVWCEVEV